VVSALHPNVPNPFNPTTTIAFDLASAGRVQLRIYDVTGKLVRTLVDESRPAGRYTETWTGIDVVGARVASGVYFYRLDAMGFASTRKMVLLQ
jgi:flagellar hook assembly protein FlgD